MIDGTADVDANLIVQPCPTGMNHGIWSFCRIRPMFEVGSPPEVSVIRQAFASTVTWIALVPFGTVAVTVSLLLDEASLSSPRHCCVDGFNVPPYQVDISAAKSVPGCTTAGVTTTVTVAATRPLAYKTGSSGRYRFR